MDRSVGDGMHLTEADRDRFWKTLVTAIVVVGTNVAANYALARGLRGVGELDTASPLAYVHALSSPWVGAGAVLMVGWMISRLALLSWADLSYVLPITALSYALSPLAGALLLNEYVSPHEWMGILLITLGVALVARTEPGTTAVPK